MENLLELKNEDIRKVDPNTLVDIKDVKIDTSLTKENRVISAIHQLKNPYCFISNGFVVKLSYMDNSDENIEANFISYIKNKMETRQN